MERGAEDCLSQCPARILARCCRCWSSPRAPRSQPSPLSSPASTSRDCHWPSWRTPSSHHQSMGSREGCRGGAQGREAAEKCQWGQRAAGGHGGVRENDGGRRWGRGFGLMWLVAVLETYILMDKRRAHGGLGLLMNRNISSGPKFCFSNMQNCAAVETV
jgi:hypothetical protein